MGFLLHSAWFYVCMASTLVAHISYALHLEQDAVPLAYLHRDPRSGCGPRSANTAITNMVD